MKKLLDVINEKYEDITGREVTEEGELSVRWRIDSSGFFNIYLNNQNILSGMIQMVDMEEGGDKE